MYQIIKNGETIAMTEKLTYIRKHDNGCYVLCAEADAQGIAHEGTPYNLSGRESMGELDEVIVCEIDGGREISNRETVESANKTKSDVDYLAMEMGVTI